MRFAEASPSLDAAIRSDDGDRNTSLLGYAIAVVVWDCLGKCKTVRNEAPRMLDDLRSRSDDRIWTLVKMHMIGVVDVMRDDVSETTDRLQELVDFADERAGYPLTYFRFLYILHGATPLLYAGRPQELWSWIARSERNDAEALLRAEGFARPQAFPPSIFPLAAPPLS